MIGQVIHNYRIEKLLDEGGMGSVYLATHIHLGRKSAIKMLNPLLMSKPESKARFKNEAIVMAKLQHPNIVSLYDYCEQETGVFLIMEYVEGVTLDSYLEEKGIIPESRIVKLFLKVLDAISYIHSKNIIHRDIKPSNFIITPLNEIKILDFGIAKISQSRENNLTKTGMKVGTALYMSPQQIRGQNLDLRTDIFSLGVMLFQMLAGEYPYNENGSEYEVYQQIINEPLPDILTFNAEVSDSMQKIIATATAKKPEDRFQNCEEFIIALLNIEVGNSGTDKEIKIKMRDLVEKRREKLFNKSFWNNFLLATFSILVIGILFFAVYLVTKKEERFVLEKTLLLRKPDKESEKIETLTFGEKVNVIDNKIFTDRSGENWLEIRSQAGSRGFVRKENLVEPKIYEQISVIFFNEDAEQQTPIFYKKELRKYFVINNFYSRTQTFWQIRAENKTSEFNFIAEGDFDNSKNLDFACVLRSIGQEKYKLLLIFDNTNTISIDFNEKIEIKTILKGEISGNWFNSSQKVRFLSQDGILLKKFNQQFIYIFNISENKIECFEGKK